MTDVRGLSRLGLPAASAGCLVAALGWIYVAALAPAGPLTSDEAAHALWGAVIVADVRAGNLLGLAYDTYRQFYWPFLDSWVLAGAFLAFGTSTLVARAVSLVFFAGLAVVLARIGAWLAPDRSSRGVGAVVAAGLAVTSLTLASQASNVMLELPALFWLCLGLGLLLRAHQRPPGMWDVLAGTALAAALLTKTNYGIVGLGAVVLDGLLEACTTGQPGLAWRRMWLTLAPALVCGIVLYSYPPKLVHTLQALANRPEGPSVWSVEGVAFYPLALMRLAGFAAPALLAGLLLSLREARAHSVRLLLLVIGIQLALGTVAQTKLDRHVLPALPMLFLLTARQASRVFDWARSRNVDTRILGAGGAAALLVLGVVSLGSLQPSSPADLDGPLARVTDAVNDGVPVLVVGEFNELSAYLVDWTRVQRGEPDAPFQSNSLFGDRDDAEIVRLTAAAGRFGPEVSAVVAHALGRSSQRDVFHAQALNGALGPLTGSEGLLAGRVVVIRLDPVSPLRGDDYRTYNAWMEPYASAIGARPDVVLQHTYRDTELGVQVLVYQRGNRGASSRPSGLPAAE